MRRADRIFRLATFMIVIGAHVGKSAFPKLCCKVSGYHSVLLCEGMCPLIHVIPFLCVRTLFMHVFRPTFDADKRSRSKSRHETKVLWRIEFWRS